MAVTIDDALIASLGLDGLPKVEQGRLKAQIFDTLEVRVGQRLAAGMTAAQLAEFEGLMTAGDKAGALRWLETNRPNYQPDVAEEWDKLLAEIKSSAPAILAASR